MLKKISDKIPAHILLLIKLYGLSLFLFFCIRLIFYFINRSSDLSSVPFAEKIMAFRMGLEFDTAVFCWIAFWPVLLFSMAYLLKNKSDSLHKNMMMIYESSRYFIEKEYQLY